MFLSVRNGVGKSPCVRSRENRHEAVPVGPQLSRNRRPVHGRQRKRTARVAAALAPCIWDSRSVISVAVHFAHRAIVAGDITTSPIWTRLNLGNVLESSKRGCTASCRLDLHAELAGCRRSTHRIERVDTEQARLAIETSVRPLEVVTHLGALGGSKLATRAANCAAPLSRLQSPCACA